MYRRIVPLSVIVPSVSWWSVWDLPLTVWRGYAAMVDKRMDEGATSV